MSFGIGDNNNGFLYKLGRENSQEDAGINVNFEIVRFFLLQFVKKKIKIHYGIAFRYIKKAITAEL